MRFSSLFLSVCLASAQAPASPAPQTPAAGSAVIKVTARLLQVSVVVRDKKGDPVSDLTKDDFVLYDRGQEQKIRYFSKESNQPVQLDAPAMAEGVVSNRFVTVKVDGQVKLRSLPDSLTVILLDGLNTKFNDQQAAKAGLVKFLKQLHPGDQVAIYALTNGLQVVHNFTSDISSLPAALDRHRSQESAAAASSTYEDANQVVNDFDVNAFLDQANAQIASFSQTYRAQTTLQALQAIANQLAGLPGRKNLVWLSSGFPFFAGDRLTTDQEQRTWRAFNDAGVAIYPVDARGLMGAADITPTLDVGTKTKVDRWTGGANMDARARGQGDQTLMSMRDLAERTGGVAALNANDISGAVRRAVDDARVTYVLSYTPSHEEWDGKFREIKIKVNPGVEVRCRKGYYALPDAPLDAQSRQAALAGAGMSPLPSTGLTVLARLIEKPAETAAHAVLSVSLDGHDIHFERNAQGQFDGTVDMLMLVFGPQPTPFNQTGRLVHLVLKPEEYTQVRKGGVRLTLDVDAPVQSQRVRVVARDAASGRVGSVDVPIR